MPEMYTIHDYCICHPECHTGVIEAKERKIIFPYTQSDEEYIDNNIGSCHHYHLLIGIRDSRFSAMCWMPDSSLPEETHDQGICIAIVMRVSCDIATEALSRHTESWRYHKYEQYIRDKRKRIREVQIIWIDEYEDK